MNRPKRILYVATQFPVLSESFLQREVRAMKAASVEMQIISLHGGDDEFDGIPIRRLLKWELVAVLYLLPFRLVTRWSNLQPILKEMFSSWPRYGLNFWENLLGFGAALVLEKEVKAYRPDVIHCVWGSSPAAFGWLSKAVTGLPFTMGAHAYDVFEHGGDWLLDGKTGQASLIHCSTESAAAVVRKMAEDSKIRVIYRGLNALPRFKALPKDRSQIRIICIARLVEKKGFPYQLAIYRELAKAGVEFEASIVGEGPLKQWIQDEVDKLGLGSQVSLLGRLNHDETLKQLSQSDLLFHTGIIAKSGDRDGLPNVIPEAMSCGVVVVASPVSGVVEAIEDGVTGCLVDPSLPAEWVTVVKRLQFEDSFVEEVRTNARLWVERNFIADKNTGKLLQEIGSVT
ncbi:glycosyltransferase family 4 protein [Puniceicoccaceae bacterium K14]|nr:glycosyltransferase family 4 protein [Puniceicoccaceae bacterium K14]